MKAIGELSNVYRDLKGNLVAAFSVPDNVMENLEKLKGYPLVIEAKKYHEKRSLNANAYFWKLCDEMAKVLGTTKEDIYMLQLSRYGVWVDIDILREALPTLASKFRYIQEVREDYLIESDRVTARCYFGSSNYTTAEMARLIDGTVHSIFTS